MSTNRKLQVCVIGAGPGGMAVLYQINRYQRATKSDASVEFDVVCYEKQSNWGGQWNLTWRTGTDEHGEHVHSTMYNHLWTNGPKEANSELPDYSYEDHFGKPIGSFPPREVICDYFNGRWQKHDLKKNIKFRHSVTCVTFDATKNTFSVSVKDLVKDEASGPIEFDFVFNCTGHYSYPNVPAFEGFDTFPGTIKHSRDVRNFHGFKGQRLLLIGACLSAEDIAIQAMKFGAQSVIISHRTQAMGSNFPSGIEERPLVIKVEGQKVLFKDGSAAEVDAIILCTGYLHHYPHLPDDLRLKGGNEFCPANLFKGIVWLGGGNKRLFYIGSQFLVYSAILFDVQSRWAVKFMAGEIATPSDEEARKSAQKDRENAGKIANFHDAIDYQSDYVNELVSESAYGYDVDTRAVFHEWLDAKAEDVQNYRDRSYRSKATGKLNPPHHTKWWAAFDDSKEAFLK